MKWIHKTWQVIKLITYVIKLCHCCRTQKSLHVKHCYGLSPHDFTFLCYNLTLHTHVRLILPNFFSLTYLPTVVSVTHFWFLSCSFSCRIEAYLEKMRWIVYHIYLSCCRDCRQSTAGCDHHTRLFVSWHDSLFGTNIYFSVSTAFILYPIQGKNWIEFISCDVSKNWNNLIQTPINLKNAFIIGKSSCIIYAYVDKM